MFFFHSNIWLKNHTTGAANSKFFTDLLGRFKKYSTLGWQEIRASGRHQQSLKASGLLRSPSQLVF